MITKKDRMKILIVDDEPENIWPLIEELEKEYEVLCATSGKEALKIAGSKPFPDLILLDIMMPDLNGYEVLSRLKAHEATKKIPVIFVTAKDKDLEEAKGIELGAHDYITKPFSPAIARARINSILNHKIEKERRLLLKEQFEDMNAQLKRQLQQRMKELNETKEALQRYEHRYSNLFQEDQIEKKFKTILIVDDNPENIQILIENLESQYEIICTTNGEEALEIAFSEIQPDLILLDIIMPGMDGYEVCSRLKANPDTLHIPVIFITSLGKEVNETKGLNLGGVDFITKPFNVNVLQARITAALRLKQEISTRELLTHKLADLNKNLEHEINKKTSELKEAHENLKISERRYRSIYHNAIEGIYQITADDRLISASPSLAKILGYESGLEMVSSITDVPHQLYYNPEDHKYFKRELEEKGEITGFETQFKKKNGERLWSMISAKAFKGQSDDLYCQGFLIDITERKRAEQVLTESEEKYRTLVDNINIGVFRSTLPGRFLQVNPAMAKIFGYDTPELLMEIHVSDLYEDPSERKLLWKELQVEGELRDREVKMKRMDETPIWTLLNGTIHYDEQGDVKWMDGVLEDITERRNLEAQLRQAQKLESLGTLAGGVAHDFNNILMAITGFGELLRMQLEDDSRLRDFTDRILSASTRAASLTQSLLAFSRKQEIVTKPLDINELIENFQKFIIRLIGEDIELTLSLASENLIAMADGGQMEQVLMNLATNARDAMPNGGGVCITTELIELDRESIKAYHSLAPGKHVVISVSDTGTGMGESTRLRIFEPFYTTKEEGKGTGLGLSIIYGIIKQHNGEITVYSEPGNGTTFRIFLPLITSGPEDSKVIKNASPRGGEEMILLAEDDKIVRGLVQECLHELGYTVISAEDGDDAVNQFVKKKDDIQLLILDVIMPKKNGRELYEEIRKIRPDIKALFTSGYSKTMIEKKGILEKGMCFLSKPATLDELARKVRDILDKPS